MDSMLTPAVSKLMLLYNNIPIIPHLSSPHGREYIPQHRLLLFFHMMKEDADGMKQVVTSLRVTTIESIMGRNYALYIHETFLSTSHYAYLCYIKHCPT